MKLIKNAVLFLLAAASAAAFLLGFNGFEALREAGMESFLLTGGLFALYLFAEKQPRLRGEWLFALLISLFFLFGDAARKTESLSPLRDVPRALSLFVLYAAFALACLRALNALFSRELPAFEKTPKHPFVFFSLLLLLFWAPQLLIKFPGTMCYDNVTQLAEFFGYTEMASDHPLFHTLLLGAFFSFGRLFGSSNLGLFLFVLMQTAFAAGVFSFTLVQMTRHRVPRYIVLIAFFVYAVSPNVTGYLSLPLKDFPYSVLYVLYTAMLLELTLSPEDFWHKKRYVLSLILSGAGIILFRLNGLLAVLPLTLVLIFRLKKDRHRLRRAGALLLSLVLSLSVWLTLNLALSPKSGSMGEPFSLFFQQTARLVRDHPESLSESDLAAIDRVLDADTVGEVYHPQNGDAVKATYKASADVRDLIAYFGVWTKGLFTHPVTYLEAAVCQNFTLFYPQINNIKYYPSVRTHHPLDTVMTETASLHGLSCFDSLRGGMTDFYTVLHCLPALGLLSNIGFWVLLLLALLFLARANRVSGFFPVTLPALITLLMCLFSPVIYLQSRYAFPLVYAMPTVLAAYFILKKEPHGSFFNSGNSSSGGSTG